MGKIRIYELAKELGVDNRVVLDKAIELGIPGKTSHSNSLDADEADQIRRALIRQAMGANAKTAEVVTTRVNKVTGMTDTVVERRSGNIIRRRRQNEEASPAAEAAEPAFEPAAEPGTYTPAEIEADLQPETPESPVEAEEASGPEAAATEPAGEAQEQVDGSSIEEAPQQPAAAAPSEPGAQTPERKVGPRVLGRIELPQQRKAPAKVEARGPSFAAPAPKPAEEEEEDGPKKAAAKRKGRKREFTKYDLVDYDREGRKSFRSPRGGGKQKQAEETPQMAQTEITTPKASKRVVRMHDVITVGELAKQLSVKASEVIAKLIELGVMATINQVLDQDITTIVAEEFGFQIESVSFDETSILEDQAADPAHLSLRPPVVTVMGHVDHGKTSLLDKIRSTSVAAREHGGITQHIGAYTVRLPNDKKITFIDTPGHAAFTAMRARGAEITDIVILVVAADDGVMPQTVEAINHAKAAKVPIVVAVNKIDRPSINVDRIKQQLTEHGLQPEDWGGETMYYPVSALKGTGVPELLDGLLLLAEMRELRANPMQRANGTIIEARQDRGRGSVATVLVQNGTLRVGDIFISGAEYGRVRSMSDDLGNRLEEAPPATPVEITGLSGVPQAGDDFVAVENEAKARQVAENRATKKKAREELSAAGPISLEEFAKRANSLAAAELNVILKADMHGSAEAVRNSIEKLSTEKVKVKVVHAAVGGVTESDVQLAIAAKAIIVGFGVRAEPRAVAIAESSGIQIRFYRIIYELLDDVKNAMVGLLAPVTQEHALGRVEVRETFTIPKIGTIAGCYVLDGLVKRGALVRLLRDSVVVHEGKMSSLKRFKDDVREVQSGYECGIGLESFNDVKTGDVMEIYERRQVAATLE